MQTTISADGTRIAFFQSGRGPALLLVHGTTADHTRWAPLLPALEQRFTVYTMDRRGRGGSGDTAPYAIEREFEDVAAVVDAIGATGDPVILLGHSYGAVCALQASLLTSNVKKLILYEPPIPTGTPFYPPALIDEMAALARDGKHEEVVTTFFLKVARVPPHEVEMLRGLPNWPARVAAAPTILREMQLDKSYALDAQAFAAMKTPTLLLLGGASPKMFADAIARANAAITTSHVVVLPEQGHTAMNTAPELFLGEVVRFIEAP